MIHDVERNARTMVASVHPVGKDDHDEFSAHGAIDRVELARAAFVVVAAAAVWFHLWEPFARFSVVGILATLVGGWPIFKEAFENVLQRRMTMELSMTIALVAALSIGQAFTALVITAFVLAAEILEHLTVSRGREAIGDLLRYLPRTAIVRHDGAIREISADELAIGDAVLVNPGSLVPVDGTVIAGHSFVDEARITGESMAAEKVAGAAAYAGTVNQRGALEIRAERLGRDTSFGRIIDAVESAERSRAPIERLADRLSGYLVYFALGAAVLTYLLTRNIVATISVIIVAGACGIAAGTPLAVLGAVGRAARAGAIVKGGRYLEALAALDTVIFDKTGTVTYGTPEVRAVVAVPGVEPEFLLRVAAVAERRSEHPLASAIAAHAAASGIEVGEPDTFAYSPGLGIRAVFDGGTALVGNANLLRADGLEVAAASDDGSLTEVHVAYGGRYLGTIGIADGLRPEAAGAVAALRGMSIHTVLLTGDVRRVGAAVGKALNVDEVLSELLPEQKSAYVGRLVDAGKIVAMVGDGLNDAPALVRATVGVAMGSGTDVARESADVVLLGNDLSRFVETVRIARRTKAIVMQNFVGTVAVDSIGILLAAMGFLNPLLAAFIHVASELTFILNSTRMLAPRERFAGGAGAGAAEPSQVGLRGGT
jgi:Cd2+/Zn2+-exporting ATPase/Cu+-exporting ATPase